MLALGIVCFLAGIFLFITDVSIRRNARRAQQAALQRENEYLTTRIHTIESQFPQALIIADARGLIRRVNPAAEEMFGYAEEELLGNNILRLLPFTPSARNPQALFFAPGQLHALLANEGVKSLRELVDEIGHMGDIQGLLQFHFAKIFVTRNRNVVS